MTTELDIASPTVSEHVDDRLQEGRGAVLEGVRRRLRQPGLLVATGVLVLVLMWAAVPSLFAPHDPTITVGGILTKPSGEHWFGTDSIGRDLYSRVVHAARLSLAGTVVAVLVGLTVGSLLGLLSGFVRGTFDAVVMRIVDVLMSIPAFLLSLAIITALGFGSVKVAIAVGITSIASFARIMRAEVVKVVTSQYVEASVVSGGRWYHNVFRHILPNASGPVLALAALEFGTAVLAISSLSFLGFGATPPTPEWGSLVAEGRSYLGSAWWLTTLPGLVLVSVVVSANRISKAFEEER